MLLFRVKNTTQFKLLVQQNLAESQFLIKAASCLRSPNGQTIFQGTTSTQLRNLRSLTFPTMTAINVHENRHHQLKVLPEVRHNQLICISAVLITVHYQTWASSISGTFQTRRREIWAYFYHPRQMGRSRALCRVFLLFATI